MALIPLYEAKTYLRVDSSDEDALIGILFIFCGADVQGCGPFIGRPVGRQSMPLIGMPRTEYSLQGNWKPCGTCRVAILYALGYLYEHRDEADHHQLMLTLRSILFAVRRGCSDDREAE